MKILFLIYLSFTSLYSNGNNFHIDTLVKPTCQSKSALGGEVKIWLPVGCSCNSISSGIIICFVKFSCKNKFQNDLVKSEFYLGDRQKWERLADYLGNMKESRWQKLSSAIMPLYNQNYNIDYNTIIWNKFEEITDVIETMPVNLVIEMLEYVNGDIESIKK